MLISIGRKPRPTPRRAGETVALSGLSPTFVDNAVAALRLSSLPTIVWWRGGDPVILEELARLADRVLLDDGEPREVWRRAAGLFETAGFSDLRWTRLTRWRTLLANFFDIAEVRAAAPAFTRLRVRGADRVAAELLASWLAWALGRRDALELAFEENHRGAFIEAVAFGNARDGIRLRLAPSGTCVATSANLDRHRCGARTVSLGDQTLSALLSEELRIRARDRAFEAAVLAWLERAEADPRR
jgi:glucose-6-phosphate dehydrogenase assembly protein OpcA